MRQYREEFDKLLVDVGGLYTYDDIMEHIADGRMQSFADGNSWAITQVHIFPRKKVVEVSYVVGDLNDSLGLETQIEEFAKSIGAEMLFATGRVGWDRRKPDTWKRLSVNYMRAI